MQLIYSAVNEASKHNYNTKILLYFVIKNIIYNKNNNINQNLKYFFSGIILHFSSIFKKYYLVKTNIKNSVFFIL